MTIRSHQSSAMARAYIIETASITEHRLLPAGRYSPVLDTSLRSLHSGCRCWTRRDTRGKRGYDGVVSASMTEAGSTVGVPGHSSAAHVIDTDRPRRSSGLPRRSADADFTPAHSRYGLGAGLRRLLPGHERTEKVQLSQPGLSVERLQRVGADSALSRRESRLTSRRRRPASPCRATNARCRPTDRRLRAENYRLGASSER